MDIWSVGATGKVILPNVLQNGSSFTTKAALPEELEPELFLKESEPCQTDPKYKLN